jgi:hypothetical protein
MSQIMLDAITEQGYVSTESSSEKGECMKRIGTLLLVLTLATIAPSAFAANTGWAVGAEFALTNISGYGAMLTFHVPKVPAVFGLGGALEQGYFNLAVIADWWLNTGHLFGIFDYYVGLGAYGNVTLSGSASIALGARVPLAAQVWPLGSKALELFLEIAPAWIPITGGGIYLTNFAMQSALGFRIWL